MSEYNAKNYTEQGGEVTHIGGTVEIDGTVRYKQTASIDGALMYGWMIPLGLCLCGVPYITLFGRNSNDYL